MGLGGAWGLPFRFWGLGQGNLGFRGWLGDYFLVFGGWDKELGSGAWGLLFNFLGAGTSELGFR